MPIETYMKYYPSTLIRKMDLNVNAKACNKFSFKNSDREIIPSVNFMVRSGYGENFSYLKQVNEFYFDTFDGVTDKVDEVITVSIFKLKARNTQAGKNSDFEISVGETYQGKKVFEEISNDDMEEGKEPEHPAVQGKVYIVEICGYCHMVDLEAFSEEMYSFSKKFSPYVQFRKSTL